MGRMRSGSCRRGAIAGALVAVLLIGGSVRARDKIDVVTLHNGDRVTCEIKSLDRGLLTVKTDNMGTIEIEWIAVRSIDSPQLFEVEDSGGGRYFGTITEADEDGRFAVAGIEGLTALDNANVVRLAQLERSWLKRWRGYVDLGYTFASANSSTDASVDAEANYRSRTYSLRSGFSMTLSDRADTDQNSRASASVTYQRNLGERWFWLGNLQGTTNSELALDLRLTAAGGAGRYLMQTARSLLSVAAGLSANRETYVGEETGDWTSEGILTTRYELFVFEGRDTSLSTSLTLLPSLSTSGRYRVEFSSSFRRKLIRDFTIALSLDDSYDSKPPNELAEKNDLRVRTTLGWSF